MEPRKVQAHFPRSLNLPSQSPRYWAREKDRYLRQLLISDIEQITNRELVVCFLRLDQSLDYQDADDLSEVLEGVKSASIDLMLYTAGGFVDAVEKFITVLKYLKPDYRVIIPSLAKSGGTLIALSSKKILMGVNSELGPVDPQINIPECGDVPAEYISQDAKFDGVYGKIAQAMFERSKKLAEKYLREGMLAGQEKDIGEALAKLSSAAGYGSHGAVIDHSEAASLKLGVEWLSPDQDLWRKLWLLHCIYDADTEKNGVGKIFEGAVYSISRKPRSD